MRPLRVLPVRTEHALHEGAVRPDPVVALLDAFGPYCSICERPVRESAFAWDPASGTTVTPFVTVTSAHPLLLCPTCEAAQARSRREAGPLVVPTETASFTIEAPRAFRYLRSGDVRPGTVATEAATATIERFRLRRFGRDDPRPSLRAETWRTVAEVVPDIKERCGDGAPPWLPGLMRASGFLSLWIEGLAEQLDGPPQVREILRVGRERPGFFPGTDWDALEGRPLP